jgi:hypothetical protein
MHVLVVFGLLINIITRLVGAIVAFDMYSKTKDVRHFLQLSGWILLFISAFLPYFITLTEDLFVANFFLVANLVFLNLGLYLLITGLSIYFASYNRDLLVLVLCTILFIPFLLFFLLDFSAAISISVIFQFVIIIIFLYVFHSNRREIRDFLQYSYGLIVVLMVFLIVYIIILAYLRLNGYDYGLYLSNDVYAIIANYGGIAMVTLLGIIVFLHLEQGIYHKQSNILKDDYSHKIGNILQIIMGAGSIINDESLSKEDTTSKADLILKKANEAGELIKQIRNM